MLDFKEDLISRYLDNSLTEREEELLLEWLQSSEENRQTFFAYKQIYASRKIQHYSNPLILENAWNKFSHRTNAIQEQRRHKSNLRLLKYAAIFLTVVSVSFFTWYILKPSKVQYTTVYVDEQEQVKELVLSDGTKVWLNNRSSLTYPISFDSSVRNVKLTGEAFFEVKSDSLHPFIVQTNAMQVRVLGTSFNVNTNTNDSTVKTTLVKGRVSINDLNGRLLSNLLPGHMASCKTSNKTIEINRVNTDLYTLWRKGLFVFDKAGLSEITAKIESTYHVSITINDQHKLNNKINFVFRKTQELDTVMEMLQFVVPVKYKRYDNQIFINAK
jgi:ferric-dicitrate binding protein FerR (iron transport regulator)